MDVVAARVMENWTLRPKASFVKTDCIAIQRFRRLDRRTAVPHTESTMTYEAVVPRIVPSGGLDHGLVILLLGLLPR